MRFTRKPHFGPYEDTRRKRLALARKQRLERERLPLFAEQIAAEQPDADTVMAERAVKWELYKQEDRDKRAARWRVARAKLFEYGPNVRMVLRNLWKTCPYPGDPTYFHDFLHSYDNGRIDPENPPWVYRGPGLRGVAITDIINRARARQGLPPLPSTDKDEPTPPASMR